MFNHQQGVSQRQAALKFGCAKSHISRILKQKTDIQFHKKKKIPSRTSCQLARIKPLCRYLYRIFRNLDWILDDWSYFTLGYTTLSGNNGFYSSNVSATSSYVKYAPKEKYEKKVLVSLIISPRGIFLKVCQERPSIVFLNVPRII